MKRLRAAASSNIELCGRVSDHELRELYARSLGFVMPGEEDFGMTAVESLASGKPVVGFGRGGVLETVPVANPIGGVLYDCPDDDSLADALDSLEARYHQIDPKALQFWASQFSEKAFAERMMPALFPERRAVSQPVPPLPAANPIKTRFSAAAF